MIVLESALGVEILQWIQQFRSPFMDAVFQGITMLGEVTLYIVILTAVYWCFSKEYGAEMTFTLLFSGLVNSSLKLAFHTQRPIGIEGIASLREHTATGYSFPSGHTQSAASFWFFLMLTQKRLWTYLIGGVLMFLVAFSRLYLGVHWPMDVVGGILFALFSVYLGRWLFRIGFSDGNSRTRLIPPAFGIVLLPLVFIIQDENLTKVGGMMIGALYGLLVERRWILSVIPKETVKRILRFIIGIIILLLIKEAGKLILPPSNWADTIRYILIGFWAAAGAPWFFKKFHL
ncbi:MAG: phosphatase PAP2 family protein [Spirochaetales bacterium]|nr:phosphatase PAP2 family protein [Spirochaetales bacterium]